MEELAQLVAQKTGLNQEMSRIAVDTVVNYLQEKLPATLGVQVEAILDNDDVVANIGSAAKGFNSIFGTG